MPMQKTQSKTTPPPAAEPLSPPLPALPALRAQTQAAKPRKALCWAAGVLLLRLGGLARWQPWVAGPTAVSVEIAGLAPVTRVLAVNRRIAAAHALYLRPLSGAALQLWARTSPAARLRRKTAGCNRPAKRWRG
jgi:hypothetical protein